MLVLTRKPDESIRIGEATVTVVRLGPNKVKLGITAPADVQIMRTELLPFPGGETERRREGATERVDASREAEALPAA